MLYLAEVQKQKTSFIGGGKAEVKLLAYQRADQSWSPVTAEEMIPAEEASHLNAGVLVLADLNPNRQVQRIEEAGRGLVSILQNLSRVVEKSKSQEKEIEEWKHSLTEQSHEMNRRRLEMEAQLEQLQHMEEDLHLLETQRQEIDSWRETVEKLQEEVEQKRSELEGAWEHLRGEQRRLEEHSSTVLDHDTIKQIQELLDRLSNGVTPTEAVRQELNVSFEMIGSGQNILNLHWQQLEQQRLIAQQKQQEVDHQSFELKNRLSECQQLESSLEQAKLEFQGQNSGRNSKQEYAQLLTQLLSKQEELYQQIHHLVEPPDEDMSQKVDLEALEKMPLEQLEQVVADLEHELQKNSQFVNDQEEELRYQQQTIDEVQAKLSKTNNYDLMNELGVELAEAQDCYQMLNETLVGQRQNLRERKQILRQHQTVLWQRQGINRNSEQDEQKIDLQPLLLQVDALRQQQQQELQKLEQQISQSNSGIEQLNSMIDHQAQLLQMKRQELQTLEQNLLANTSVAAECWGRVNLYQEMLQPVQDSLDRLRSKLEAIAMMLPETPQNGDHPSAAIDQMRQKLLSMMSNS